MQKYTVHHLDDVDRTIWENSKFKQWIWSCNAHKGKTGELLVVSYHQSLGREAKRIRKKGDVVFVDEGKSSTCEVKTAKVDPDGCIWFNQIRVIEKEWEFLNLVGIFPDQVIIWQIPRNEAIEAASGFAHPGQSKKELVSIQGTLEQLAPLEKYILTRISNEEIEFV